MSTASQRQNLKEKEQVQQYLAGWCEEKSLSYALFITRYGKCPKKPDLFKIAKIISQMIQISGVNRAAQRYKDVCLKWFDDHFNIVRPYLENLYILESQPATSNESSSQDSFISDFEERQDNTSLIPRMPLSPQNPPNTEPIIEDSSFPNPTEPIFDDASFQITNDQLEFDDFFDDLVFSY